MKSQCECTNTYVAIRHESGECLIKCRDCGRYVEDNPQKKVVDEVSASPNVFFRSDDDMYYTLDQLGYDITNMDTSTMHELAINYGYRWSEENNGWYHRDEEYYNH